MPEKTPDLATLGYLLTGDHSHQLLSQEPLLSDEDLRQGTHLYYQARRKIGTLLPSSLSAEQRQLLEKAEKYHSFHAIQLLLYYDLKQLQGPEASKEIDTESIIRRAYIAAKYHLTPGYLLLTHTLRYVAKYQNEMLKDSLGAETTCYESFYALTIAELLAPHSNVAIRNAYNGQSLLDAIHKAIDPRFTSFFMAKKHILGSLKQLDIPRISKLISAAKDKTAEIMGRLSSIDSTPDQSHRSAFRPF